MEIIGAAALIAFGIVVAAALYGRSHAASVPVVTSVDREAASALQATLAERSASLDRREDAISRREDGLEKREADINHERESLAAGRLEVEQTLESLAGMSGAKAKQLLLAEVEDQAKHDAARRLRQIEEETKREAERRVRNILSVC